VPPGLVLGGFVTLGMKFKDEWVGWISIIIGMVVLAIEWPRSKRKQGRTLARTFQHKITPCVSFFSKHFCLSNLFVRFLLYITLSIPTFFELPCILGGAILIICATVYLIAALKGEVWVALAADRARKQTAGQIIAAPTRAPPRFASGSTPGGGGAGAGAGDAPKVRSDSKAALVLNEAENAPTKAPPAAPTRTTPKPKARAEPQWIGRLDAGSGKTYYESIATKETQWDLPPGMVIMEGDMSI
jgi:cytochrome b-245 alpha polypeptide